MKKKFLLTSIMSIICVMSSQVVRAASLTATLPLVPIAATSPDANVIFGGSPMAGSVDFVTPPNSSSTGQVHGYVPPAEKSKFFSWRVDTSSICSGAILKSISIEAAVTNTEGVESAPGPEIILLGAALNNEIIANPTVTQAYDAALMGLPSGFAGRGNTWASQGTDVINGPIAASWSLSDSPTSGLVTVHASVPLDDSPITDWGQVDITSVQVTYDDAACVSTGSGSGSQQTDGTGQSGTTAQPVTLASTGYNQLAAIVITLGVVIASTATLAYRLSRTKTSFSK
jgi:hypothetical protein